MAQLGARLDGIEEVEGSNPFGSTKFLPCAFPFTSFKANPQAVTTLAKLNPFLIDSRTTTQAIPNP